MASLNAASTLASVALVCIQPLFVAAFSGVLLHEPMSRAARPGALTALFGGGPHRPEQPRRPKRRLGRGSPGPGRGLRFPPAAWPCLAALVLGSTLLGEPVGAMLWAMLFFKEFPTLLVALGGGVVPLGLCLSLRAGIKPAGQS